MWWTNIGLPAVCAAVIIGVGKLVLDKITAAPRKRKRAHEEIMAALVDIKQHNITSDQKIDALKSDMDSMQAQITTLDSEVKTINTRLGSHASGLQAVLRDRLIQAFRYYEIQGWASQAEKENVTNMYKNYEALGENGIMEARYDAFLALPFQPSNANLTPIQGDVK